MLQIAYVYKLIIEPSDLLENTSGASLPYVACQ